MKLLLWCSALMASVRSDLSFGRNPLMFSESASRCELKLFYLRLRLLCMCSVVLLN